MADYKKESDEDVFKKLLELDKQISEALSLAVTTNSKLGNLRPQMKWLEYSCHGLFWIPGCIIALWFCEDPYKVTFFFNLLLALLLDIVFVAIIKASLRRERPSYNHDKDMFFTIGPDKMSCPSGHTSRAVMLSLLLMTYCSHLHLLHPFLVIWSFATSVSRILLGRHFVGDVLIGLLLGYAEYALMQYVWAGPETAKWYLDIFSNSSFDDL